MLINIGPGNATRPLWRVSAWGRGRERAIPYSPYFPHSVAPITPSISCALKLLHIFEFPLANFPVACQKSIWLLRYSSALPFLFVLASIKSKMLSRWIFIQEFSLLGYYPLARPSAAVFGYRGLVFFFYFFFCFFVCTVMRHAPHRWLTTSTCHPLNIHKSLQCNNSLFIGVWQRLRT